MAVYTEITTSEFTSILKKYSIGDFVSAKGIAEGVENSNYLLITTQGPFIATVYEKRVNPKELPFFLELKEFLHGQGIPCPKPIRDNQGTLIQMVEGRPFAMVSFLQGGSPKRPTIEQCAELGAMLGRIHVATESFTQTRANSVGVKSWQALYNDSANEITKRYPAIASMVEGELAEIAKNWPSDLPKGIIHADLFPDNALFLEDKLTGVIDFYFACTDLYAFDLAMCLNAWCFEASHEFNATKTKHFLAAYNRVRPLQQNELDAMPILCRGAAMRFLLTRLHDSIHTVPGAVVTIKNPQEYADKLKFHREVKSYHEYGL